MLTELECKNFEAKEKSYKKFDGGGMFLLIKSDGSKYWRLKYNYAGKEKLIALGVYPKASLKETKKRMDKCKEFPDFRHINRLSCERVSVRKG